MTTLDRPAAAPPTGDFEFGYHAIAHPTFVAGITAVATIFCSGAGTSAFLPVISEMKKPRDYNKAVYLCSTYSKCTHTNTSPPTLFFFVFLCFSTSFLVLD